MLLTYIRTKQVYNTRIKDNTKKKWIHLTEHEIVKYGGFNELMNHINQGNIVKHPTINNTYTTTIYGVFNLSLLDKPFYKEQLYIHMYTHLLHVELEQASISNDLQWFNYFLQYRESLKSLFFKVDNFSGRIHTPITNLKKEYRKNVIFHGEPISSLDIATFQPTLLAKILVNEIGDNDFSKFIFEENDIYILIQEKLELESRNKAKEEFCTIIFGKPNNKLSSLFPNSNWLEWINDLKRINIKQNISSKGYHTNLVWLLQNYEVKIMREIWNTLVINKIPFLTVHDEIIVQKSLELDAYYIMQLILDKELFSYKINVS